MKRVIIIDYGSGNLKSVYNSVKFCSQFQKNLEITVSNNPKKIDSSTHIILPGVGSFKNCLDGFYKQPDLKDSLQKNVFEFQKPFLGICVGMQMMMTNGYEDGLHRGFNWFNGDVKKLSVSKNLKLPHIGWNNLKLENPHPIIENLKKKQVNFLSENNAYFVHSYSCLPTNKKETIISTEYGGKISAMIGKQNIVGTQFHPEKSHLFGLAFLDSFLDWNI